MAILSTLNLLSEQRLDVSDMRRLESAVRNDFDSTVTSIFTNTTQGYIVRGFSIITGGAIGAPANGLQMQVDPGAVLHIAASVSGTIFQTPLGTANQTLNAATNTNVSGSFTANSINYVGIDYNRFADSSTNVTKYIWSAAATTEITTIAPAAQTLTFKIYITTSVWAANVLPVAIVTTDSNGNVVSVTDARWMMYSLETGGLNPNPSYTYPWSAGRTQPPVTVSAGNSTLDPFSGGDKQLTCFKDWANAVMSQFLEIKGTPEWFSGPNASGPLPSLQSLFQDLGNTVITGSGQISNGILPNSDPVLVTTGTTTNLGYQLTAVASTAGLTVGDYIFATGVPFGTTIVTIGAGTITMSRQATISASGVTLTFYNASVITTPGQINWNDPIQIRVVGSALTYMLEENDSSTDIQLADDEVAYIKLIREQPIAPSLIFVTGSKVVTSVGSVFWTAGLSPGDYIKVASDTVSSYYRIAPVGDPTYPSGGIINSFTVGLESVVLAADNTGTSGAQAEYAYGTYYASPSPVGDDHAIQIAPRAEVPIAGNIFWLFLREDNGGANRVYIRFLSQELDNGESVEVSGTTSLELLQYIGSPSASASRPQYVNALNPNSQPQITGITIGNAATITGGQYFLINSAANARKYAVWFKKSGVGSAPVVPFVNAMVEVDILIGDTATQVALKLSDALDSTPSGDFNASAGVGTVTVTNTSSGTATVASNATVGAPFAITTTQSGTGTGNYVVHDGDNLTLAVKELDVAFGNLYAALDSPSYDETITIVASGATPPDSLNGPISSGTVITIPLNSRTGGTLTQYTVGKGSLQIFLNGQFLDLESGAYSELGSTGAPSNTFTILYGLVVGDELEIRMSGGGGGAGGGGVGPAGPAGPTGAAGPPGANAAGGPIAISVKTSDYTALLTDNFLLADCTSNTVTFTLPAAASAAGRILYLKKIDASINDMFVQANGAELIDGLNNFSTVVQYQEYSIVCDGTQWWIF